MNTHKPVIVFERPLTIALLGRSGSGKGTQAKMLMARLENPLYIVTGNLLRELAAANTVAGCRVAAELRAGALPPYWLAYTLWQRELVEKLADSNQDVLFDGAPRRVKEAESLDEVFAWLERPPVIPVLIDITRDEAFGRLKGRGREDDTDANINNRLSWYETDVLSAVRYYEKLGRLVRVDGMPAPEKVFENLLAALGMAHKNASEK